jgi:hypothetical protein
MTKDEALKIDNSDFNKCTKQELFEYIVELRNALEQPSQEPYRCYWVEKGKGHCERNNRMGLPDSYTHPHQWQGLTDDEILDLEQKYTDLLVGGGTMFHFEEFARAIEQALKDKNSV